MNIKDPIEIFQEERDKKVHDAILYQLNASYGKRQSLIKNKRMRATDMKAIFEESASNIVRIMRDLY